MSVISIPPRKPSSPLASMRGHHVGIRVRDLEASKNWFIEKLDFRVVQSWQFEDLRLAYLAPPDDDGFMIELVGDGLREPVHKPIWKDLGDSLGMAGHHHLCFNVGNVDTVVAELRMRGVHIVAEPFELPVIGRRLAFFADPFGNLFELAEVLA